jgi:hypothetical protein
MTEEGIFRFLGDSIGFIRLFFEVNSEFFVDQKCTLTSQDEYLFKDNKHIHNGQQKGENY